MKSTLRKLRMQTETLPVAQNLGLAVAKAVRFLAANEVVALPTETVYGLAGNALEPVAVARIFAAKERPCFDPLIVHVLSRDWIAKIAKQPRTARLLTDKLIARFWPGPLTILFPKTDLVPDLVTSGLQTVAIRMPRHPVFVEVLKAFGKPLAAPSANRFGRITPTRAEHVQAELNHRIPLILDAGPTAIGLESTVVRVRRNRIEILRPGPITEEMLSHFAPVTESPRSQSIVAPGQTLNHYSPEKNLHLIDLQLDATHSAKAGLICWGPVHYLDRFSLVRSLSERKSLPEAAMRLFGLLRELDQADVTEIFVEPVPETGIGKAIMNRLRRAAAARPDYRNSR